MKRNAWLVAALAMALLAVMSFGAPVLSQPAAPAALPALAQATPAAMASTDAPVDQNAVVTSLETTVSQIYDAVAPSVVQIQVTAGGAFSTGGSSPFGPSQPQSGLGSGFVWDSQGRIVTNNHVVDGADTVNVTFMDGTSAAAKVLGTDPNSDLAVIQVDVPAQSLHPVHLGDSTQLRVGQLVVAIGNPFGLQGSLTVGFVSATGRLLPLGDNQTGPGYNIPDMIQTDTPINPGNSGGVLVDDRGEVVGVPSALISPAGVSAGVGFAIPSAIVAKVAPSLITTGTYEHPYLGITGLSVTTQLAAADGLDTGQRGVMIIDVAAGGPADKAALRGGTRQVTIDGEAVPAGGDVIVAVNGQPVKNFNDLLTYLARNASVGDKLSLRILRDGKEQDVQLTLEARPNPQARSSQLSAGDLGA